MIAYSARTGRTRALLLKRHNDMDVFVEDTRALNAYVRLINRLLGKGGHISSVFPLGGRQSVLAQCAADQLARPRPRVYIIDGDQELINTRRRPPLRHLYRLKAYSIENILVDEHAAIVVAMEGLHSATYADVERILELRRLLGDAATKLLPLFVVYGIAYRFSLPIETIGYSVVRLLDDQRNPMTLSPRLIRGRIRGVLRELRQRVSKRKYRSAKAAIVRLLRRDRRVDRFISGKDYLMPLLQMQLARRGSVRDSPNALKVRLAASCGHEVDPLFGPALRSALRRGGA